VLNSLINKLKQNPKLKLQLKAHVDNSYQGLQNISAFEIGLMHAHAVKKYLIKQGIPKDHIRVLSEGTSKPIGNKNTTAGQLLNTRMEYEWFK
jgi:outer membrane protein OmpA-like peptidoglycan-associated protein